MKPQTENILLMLEERGERGITALDALREEGCLRLAARIGELREHGLDIEASRERTPNGKQIARYVLRSTVQRTLWRVAS
jgi:hypothetical protein